MNSEEYRKAIETHRSNSRWSEVLRLAEAQFESTGETVCLVHVCEASIYEKQHARFEVLLEPLIAREPNSRHVVRLKALHHQAVGNWPRAVEYWSRLGDLDKSNVSPFMRVVEIHLQQRDLLEAAKHLETLRERFSDDERLRRLETRFAKAIAETPSADLPAVIAQIAEAPTGSHPSLDIALQAIEGRHEVALLFRVAVQLHSAGQFERAARIVSRLRGIAKGNVDHDLLAAQIHLKLGEFDTAKALLISLKGKSDSISSQRSRFAVFVGAYYQLFGKDAFVEGLFPSAKRFITRQGDLTVIVNVLAKQGCGPTLRDFLGHDCWADMSQSVEYRTLVAAIGEPDGSIRTDALATEFGRYFSWQASGCPISQERNPERDALAALVDFLGNREIKAAANFAGLATELLNSEKISLVQRIFEAYASPDFECGPLLRLRAHLTSKTQNWTEAAQRWIEVVSRSQSDLWAQLSLINAYINSGNPTDAGAVFDKIVVPDGQGEAGPLAALASAAIRLGMVDKARVLAGQVLQSDNRDLLPSHQRTQFARVLALTGLAEQSIALHGAKNRLDPGEGSKFALIVDPGLTITSGHHLNYTLFAWRMIEQIVHENSGLTPLVLCRPNVDLGAELGDVIVSPSLTFEPYAYDAIPNINEYLAELNNCFYQDLKSLSLEGQAALVVMHSMRAALVDGFSRWIDEMFRSTKGVVVIGLIEVDHLVAATDVVARHEDVYRIALRRIMANRNVRLIVYVETEAAKRFLDGLGIGELTVNVYPYLAASLSLEHKTPLGSIDTGPITLGIVGGTRRDRGLSFFPELIARTQDLAARCRWKLQLNSRDLRNILGPQTSQSLDALSDWPNTTLVEGPLSSSAYFGLLSEIDVMILPYRERYAVSGSGVFYESLYMGKYLLVPRNSFMPDELQRYDHPHRIIEEMSLSCIEANVRQIVADQKQIKAQLRSLSQNRKHTLPADSFHHSIVSALLKQGYGSATATFETV